jgi:hypothetical protein
MRGIVPGCRELSQVAGPAQGRASKRQGRASRWNEGSGRVTGNVPNSESVLLVHNHPSGDPTPSEEDVAMTRRLEEAGQTLGISVLDHIIAPRHGAASIAEHRSRQAQGLARR